MKNQMITRKNLRIKNYDYSNIGFYFITICIKDRSYVLSKISEGENNTINLKLLPYGEIVQEVLMKTNNAYKEIKIRDYVIMPNHVHFICEINSKNKLKTQSKTKERIPMLISSIKRIINRKCHEKIWQRNYYEHIIRNSIEYLKIVEYIQNNPYNWADDKYNKNFF